MERALVIVGCLCVLCACGIPNLFYCGDTVHNPCTLIYLPSLLRPEGVSRAAVQSRSGTSSDGVTVRFLFDWRRRIVVMTTFHTRDQLFCV